MSTETKNLILAQEHLQEMRKTLSVGVSDPEKAAQCACAALLTLTDLLEGFVTEALDEL